jgi:hypothetical protein
MQGIVARTWFTLGFLRAAYVGEAFSVALSVLSEPQQRESVGWQLTLNFGRLVAFLFVAACCVTTLERLGELPVLANNELFHMFQCSSSGPDAGEWSSHVGVRHCQQCSFSCLCLANGYDCVVPFDVGVS